jgi:surfactin synthase thioesterase subunit
MAGRTTAIERLVRPRPNPAASRMLVCLSYCGGGTSAFRRWAAELDDDVELAIVCYPGREGRFTEPFCQDWEALATEVLTALHSLGGRPFVLFGHSMGAWLAFDVAARLEQRGVRGPEALVVSASDAPSRYAAIRDRPPLVTDSDEALRAWLRRVGQLDEEILADPDLQQMALDLLRADMRVSDTYRYMPGVTVRAPMHLLYGAEDEEPAAEVARRWRLLAAGEFRADVLPGGHFYTEETWAGLPNVMLGVPTVNPARDPVRSLG